MNNHFKKLFFILSIGCFLFFSIGCGNDSKTEAMSKSAPESNYSKPSSSRKTKSVSCKTCRCGKQFSHSGYRIGWGDNGYGMNDKIGVKPGPNCSEYCAFIFENY